MKVISFLNIKGGVGKTTSTVNIAAELGRLGYEVLIIDIDPQANATNCIPHTVNDNQIDTYTLLNECNNYTGSTTTYKNISLVASNINLIKVESKLDINNITENSLRKWVEEVPEGSYDFILIDCPPSLGMLTTNALVASHYVLVPIKIDNFALLGLDYLISSIEQVKQDFNQDLKLLGMFVTMDENTNINKEIKKDLAQAFQNKFFKQTIRKNVDVVKSTFEMIPVSYFNIKSNAAKDYKELTREVLQCLISQN